MDQRQFTVRYSEPLVRSAIWRYFGYLLRREFNWTLYLAAAALVAVFIYRVLVGPASWFEGALGAALCLIVIFFVVLYRAHLTQGLQRFRSMAQPVATFTATDEALTVSSGSGSSTVPWQQLDLVLDFGDFWLFRLKQRATFTMPTEGIDESSLNFIRTKILGGVRAV